MLICDECKFHSYAFMDPEQKRAERRKHADCKNLIYENGELIGQCGCFGPEHGESEYF